MQRHLATLEALDAHATARGLALAAAAAGLPHAGADTAPDAHAFLARTRLIGNLVESHGFVLLLRVADHAHEVLHLADHAAGRRCVRQIARAADFVETEPDQCLPLIEVAPLRAPHLLDLDSLLSLSHARSLSRPPPRHRRRGVAIAASRP